MAIGALASAPPRQLVLVQREMESGRAPFSEYNANSEGGSSHRRKRGRLAEGCQRPKPQLVS